MTRVLFVGGTSYSGSTLLDMMLAHDPAGFSCGELMHFVCPPHARHRATICGCGDADCRVWDTVARAPLASLYEPLFARLGANSSGVFHTSTWSTR